MPASVLLPYPAEDGVAVRSSIVFAERDAAVSVSAVRVLSSVDVEVCDDVGLPVLLAEVVAANVEVVVAVVEVVVVVVEVVITLLDGSGVERQDTLILGPDSEMIEIYFPSETSQ